MKRGGLAVLLLALVAGISWGTIAWGAPGDPLWETTFNYLPNYNQIEVSAMAATSNTLIVCGDAFNQQLTGELDINSLGFIRAYDVASGNLKWQGVPLILAATNTPGAQDSNFNRFDQIILKGNIAMVCGSAFSYTFNGVNTVTNLRKTVVRAYNADTGQLLWENVRDGNHFTGGAALTTLPGSDRAFTAGQLDDAGNGFVRAYQIPGGSPPSLPLLLLE
jgi:outer membrane protein assembly factor BamB